MGLIFKAILFEFILTACNIYYALACIEASSPVHGNMTKDYDLLVGSELTVQCTLFSNEAVINGTRYNVSSKNLVIKFGKVAVEDLVIVDPFSVSYSIQNSTVNDTGTYTCYLSLPELESMIFVCTTYVAVGYPPLPVENFSCLSLHYKNLTCTWVKPFNPVKTNYEIWDYFQFVALKRRCPEMINASACQWRLDSYPPYRKSAKTLYFLLLGNNSLGLNRQSIIIDHFKFVKPAPVQRLHFSNITRDSVLVNWSAPSGMEYNDFPPGLIFSIKYCPISPVPKRCTEVESSGSMMHVIENLIPYTEYQFKIRCRSSVAEGEDMWSPTVGLTMQTLPDVPYLAPKVTFSSYEVKTIVGNRSITLFWKAIPSEYQNGKNLRYIIQYHMYYVRTKRENYEIEVGNVTSYTFKHMDMNTAYIFKIFAKNDVGSSPESSHIVVDKNSKLLSAPRDFAVLSHGRGNYTVSWTPSPLAKGYTLFWCQEIRPWPFKCEGPLQWMHTVDTYHELNLYDIDTNFQFAVSANDGNVTSGLKWATCFVPYSGVLYKVKSVNLTPKNSTSMEVQWTLDCDAQRAVIKEYAINYCKVEGMCSGNRNDSSCIELPNRRVFYQSSLNEHMIGGLQPYSCYRIFVRARTEDGWSEDSDVSYESTLPSAPSDSPRNSKVVQVNDTSILISFRQPLHPNGRITRYVVSYVKTPSYPNTPKHHKEVQAYGHPDHVYEVEISTGIFYFTNYSIEVAACVDKSCSPLSKPVYALTGIGYPGIMDSPHIQMINSSYVNITWKPPTSPNGPVEMYQVVLRYKDNGKEGDNTADNEINEIFNVSDSTFLSINLNCPQDIQDETMYFISVRAVNVKDDTPLFGPHSKETESTLCFATTGPSYGMVVGIAVGCAFGLVIFVGSIYWLLTWMKTEVDLIKGINVQLPKGLDSPADNPLSPYDKFKKGLQTKTIDSGLTSYERAYDRLCSFASEVDIAADGLAQKEKRESNGRNNSGESNTSNKCHDSISSTHTTKTHLSIDSGTEVDSPPSPDGFFSDTTTSSSSNNTTPRSYKPDLAMVKEGHGIGCNSKDSGLEKEDPLLRCIDLPSKFAWYVKKKNHNAYSNLQCVGQMAPYSKFSVVAPASISSYVRLGEQNLLDNHSLSNSEPSVADFEVASDCEPLVMPGISPYSKFGLARSAGNGINIGNPAFVDSNNLGYAKFGIVYRALKCQDFGSKESPFMPSELKVCPKFLSQPQAMPAVIFNRNMMVKGSSPVNKSIISDPVGNAYSKIGKQQLIPKKNDSHKGYVSFHEALSKPIAENVQARPSDVAYSKFSVSASPEVDNVPVVPFNPVNPTSGKAYSNFGFTPESSQESGYISFRDAKVMFVEYHPERETNADSQPCSISLEDISSSKDSSVEEDASLPVNGTSTSLSAQSKENQLEHSTEFSVIEPIDVISDDFTNKDINNMCGIDTGQNGVGAASDEFVSDPVDKGKPVEVDLSTLNGFQPFCVDLLNDDVDDLDNDIVHTYDHDRLPKPPNTSYKPYVPLSELARESAQVVTLPNAALPLHIETV